MSTTKNPNLEHWKTIAKLFSWNRVHHLLSKLRTFQCKPPVLSRSWCHCSALFKALMSMSTILPIPLMTNWQSNLNTLVSTLVHESCKRTKDSLVCSVLLCEADNFQEKIFFHKKIDIFFYYHLVHACITWVWVFFGTLTFRIAKCEHRVNFF